MYMYIVLAVPRQDSIRLACANAVQASCCPVGALQLICWKLLSKRHVSAVHV